MSNYEKINNSFEDDRDQREVTLFGQIVPKVIRKLEIGPALNDMTLREIDRIIKKTFKKSNVEFDKNALLLESFERMAIRDGGLSDKLQEVYEKVLAERIADTVQKQGMDSMYEVLKEQLMALKSKNIYVNDEGVERKVMERLHVHDVDNLEEVEVA